MGEGTMQDASRLVGFFCDTPMVGSGYFGMLQMGLMTRCRKAHCELLIKAFDLHEANITQQAEALIARTPLLGVILTEPMCDMQDLVKALLAAGLPVVRIAPHTQDGDTFDIYLDNYQAAYDMTSYLIRQGHKRIAFVKGPPDHHDANVRFAAYCKALEDAGLPVIEELCAPGTFEYASGLAAGEQLLSLKPLPSAIFACNDEMAAAVLATAHRLGLRIPEDFSLAGFDDSPLARSVWPSLTTCRQKMELMGYLAADFLIDPPADAASRKRPQQHELVIRDSTAPAGA
ncbi:MAG: substrate-binding domain-containing protein [Alphaproteobacteria bacterium]|nr:substrate-binding domain-containing protein [Alphaproteobacteria bacterium]